MAIRTSSSTARNTSYSKPSVPKKPSSASRSSSVWYGSCSQSSNGKVTIDKNVNATMNLGDKNKCLGSSIGYGYMTVSK